MDGDESFGDHAAEEQGDIDPVGKSGGFAAPQFGAPVGLAEFVHHHEDFAWDRDNDFIDDLAGEASGGLVFGGSSGGGGRINKGEGRAGGGATGFQSAGGREGEGGEEDESQRFHSRESWVNGDTRPLG